MVTARLLDEAALRQNRQGRAPFVVPAEGHEACQVGTAWPMRNGVDVWLPYYRDLAVVLRAGMTPYEIFLGMFAKAADPSSGGRQMPSHWGHKALGIISGSSPIATQVPHASGIAYAARYRGEDASWRAGSATAPPARATGTRDSTSPGSTGCRSIFVCENNHYAISVPQSKQMAVENVADRAAGYGFPGVVVDGNDVLACYGAMKSAHERARAGEGPTLIECKTYRFLGHTSDDDDKTYRTRDEVEEARHHDPIERFGAYLGANDLLSTTAAESAARRGQGARSTPRSRRRGRLPDPLSRDRAAARVRRGGRGGMSEKNLVTAIRDALHDEMAADDRVVLLGEDVGNRGGVFRISAGWMEEFGEDRVIDTPLAESGIIGVAIGMALHGLLPVAEIQFADFIFPAFDQIVSEAARMRYRSNGAFGLPVGDPHAVRRRDPRRAVPLPVDRGVLRARPGPEGRDALDARRRGRAAAQRDPRPRPGAVPRAQEDLPRDQGRGSRRTVRDPRSASRT